MTCECISASSPDYVSVQGRLANELKISFGQSLAVSSAIAETADSIYRNECQLTVPGMILYSAVHLSEPAGKPLENCRRVLVKLSLWDASDEKCSDMRQRRKKVLNRIVTQAYDQDGVLTIEDCQKIMICDKRTIKRYISEYKKNRINLPLRGYVHSTGRGQTHKTEIICFYLEGMEFTGIQHRTYHSIEAISRYIRTFSRIVICHVKQQMKMEDIATVVNVSVDLVKKYLGIYEKYSSQDNSRLQMMLNPAEFDSYVLPLKKKLKK